MSKFADYLRSLGTAEADITVLDTPAAQKAYDAMEARMAEAVKVERDKMETYQGQVNQYYETTNAKAKQLENQAIVATAEAARAKAALLEAQRQGLIDVARDLGYTPDDQAAKDAAARAAAERANGGTNVDELMKQISPALESAGDGLAAVMDAMVEHTKLFPDRPFNAREIRRQSVAAHKPFYQYWEETFKVADARAAAAAAAQKAHDDKIAKDARDAAIAEMASTYGNPATRPAVPSNAPFVVRKSADGKPEAPWARSESEASDARVRRATENLIKSQGTGATH
jgi:hypothetical protein